MSDLISRQAAIDAVEFGVTYAKAINKSTGEVKELFKEGNKALNEAVERLNGLPSAQPEMSEYSDKLWKAAYERGKAEAQQRWIPCSEREPEEYGEYRITWTTSASKKRFIGDSEYEVTDVWDADHYRFKGEWLLDDYVKNYPDVKVIAWKPLEEPYAERRTDE